jgi:hypothetical protein
VRSVEYGAQSRWIERSAMETRGSSGVMFDAECSEHIDIGNTALRGPEPVREKHHVERSQAHRLAMMTRAAKAARPQSLQSLLWFDPAGGLLPSRPHMRAAIARSGSARMARSATRRARP